MHSHKIEGSTPPSQTDQHSILSGAPAPSLEAEIQKYLEEIPYVRQVVNAKDRFRCFILNFDSEAHVNEYMVAHLNHEFFSTSESSRTPLQVRVMPWVNSMTWEDMPVAIQKSNLRDKAIRNIAERLGLVFAFQRNLLIQDKLAYSRGLRLVFKNKQEADDFIKTLKNDLTVLQPEVSLQQNLPKNQKGLYFNSANDKLDNEGTWSLDIMLKTEILSQGHTVDNLLDLVIANINQNYPEIIVPAPVATPNLGMLLDELKLLTTPENKALDMNSPFGKAGKNVYEAAYKLHMTLLPAQVEERKALTHDVGLAINVLKNPMDQTAIVNLKKAATNSPFKTSHKWQNFIACLSVLAGAAIIGLSIAGIPFTGHLSLIGMYIGGSVLCAGGAALFYKNSQKTFADKLADIANTIPTNQPVAVR